MYLDDSFVGITKSTDYWIASFWRVVTDMGVPCFVMLSGAFLIREKNAIFTGFYRYSLRPIVNITVVFSVIYIVFHYAENILASIMRIGLEEGKIDYIEPLINWAKGEPHVTMWYMYMIIPMYIVVPVIVLVKKSISKKSYRILGLVMLVYSIVVAKTCVLSWILRFVSFWAILLWEM